MKILIGWMLAVLILISSFTLMVACDVVAEETPEDSSLNESKTPVASEAPALGRTYGDYQIITLTDEATIELVENMWTHKSWQSIGLMPNLSLCR